MKRLSLGIVGGFFIGMLSLNPAVANVRLPSIISHNMVLQCDVPIPLWGWADPQEKVTVTLGGEKVSTQASAAGKWEVKMPAVKASKTPLEMIVAGKNALKVSNILVGEVWLGAGGVNMTYPVASLPDVDDVVAEADLPEIRLFVVNPKPAGKPLDDIAASWQVCDAATVSYFSAVLFSFGRDLHKKLNVPVGLVCSALDGSHIQGWIPRNGLAAVPELKRDLKFLDDRMEVYERSLKIKTKKPIHRSHPLENLESPTGVFNGAIHPLVPFAIRGVVWYQGEANIGQGSSYADCMKGLAKGWRELWKLGDFPILYVQLAPFEYPGDASRLPDMWEAQSLAQSIPNTAMVVTNDIGDLKEIQPPNKEEVGRRLLLCALAKAYGQTDVEFSGPVFESFKIDEGRIRIKFKNAEGLTTRNGKPPSWFFISGDDKRFVPAETVIEGDEVILSSERVKEPAQARFAWAQFAEPNLVNRAGLPAAAFRTDRWSNSLLR